MVDLRELYKIFVEETTELMTDIEDGLLQLEKSPDDKDLIDTIFRAAHTIKGSSGSIGLRDISKFTHSMEEVLDLMRQNKLVTGRELINTFLEANDLLKEMVDAVATDAAFDYSRSRDLSKRMGDLKQNDKKKEYKIVFVPDHDLFRRGIDPAIIIEDLKGIGEITNVKAYTRDVPALSEMNPEELYLRWNIHLKTDRNEEEIKKIFESVEEGSEVTISPVTSPQKEVPMIGEILIQDGKVTAEDVKEALKSQKRLGEILVEQGKVSKEDIEKIVNEQNRKKSESFKKLTTSTIRVDLEKLDHLINTVGEMVIIHSMLQQALQNSNALSVTGNESKQSIHHSSPITHHDSERVNLVFSQLQRVGNDIQETAMSLRMLPIGEIFHRFMRLVREISASKNKSIELVITGEETEMDKGVLEKITDPLVHLIRNAIYHGIEPPEERTSVGKPVQARIHLGAYQIGDSVYIEVEDDGRGLSKEKILEKALSKGIISSTEDLTDDQIHDLIFMPGFSTAEQVTDISGRGVGMDVVKRNVESLNGKVYIHTKPGTGTSVSIKLPLTLAIIEGLKVLIGDNVYVVPLLSVIESLRPRMEDVKTLNERGEVINIRGEFIPLIRPYEDLGIMPMRKNPWEAIVVIVSHDKKKCCLLVDDLVGEQQVVIKNLGTAVPKVRGIGGGTILGDGRVALVFDVPGLVESATEITHSVINLH